MDTLVNATLTGGDDTIIAHGPGLFIGDVFDLSVGGVLNGGDDSLLLEGPVNDSASGTTTDVVGDASIVHGTVIGGNDTIEVRNVLDIRFVSGDIGGDSGSILDGGDDIITVENSTGLDIYCDAFNSATSGSGGDDTINLTGSTATTVSGDFNDVVAGSVSGGNDVINVVNSSPTLVGGDATSSAARWY